MSHEQHPSLTIIRGKLSHTNPSGRRFVINADRWQLAKLRWRGAASDDREFGFELDYPLAHGDLVWENDYGFYIIQQAPEPVLVITAHAVTEAATLAWSIGNLHQPLQVSGHELIVPDDPAVRQLCQQQEIAFTAEHRVFQPFRAVIGHSHHHAH